MVDVNTYGATITNNRVHDNWAEGIFVEISHDATVTGNTVTGNGFHSFRGSCARIWMYGGGITIAASDNVTVLGNTVSGNCNGITATQENRPDGTPACSSTSPSRTTPLPDRAARPARPPTR